MDLDHPPNYCHPWNTLRRSVISQWCGNGSGYLSFVSSAKARFLPRRNEWPTKNSMPFRGIKPRFWVSWELVPEILYNIELNIWIRVFVRRYVHSLKDSEWNLNELVLNSILATEWKRCRDNSGYHSGLRPTQALRAGHSTARVVGDSATYVGGRAAPQPRERVKDDISVDRS